MICYMSFRTHDIIYVALKTSLKVWYASFLQLKLKPKKAIHPIPLVLENQLV